MEDIVLDVRKVTKCFPGVKALCDVDFKLKKGEIHCLMGENGAGKSTLIKVITGVYEVTEGKILFNNKSINFKSPLEAQKSGISTVYQEVNLCGNLSVAENIFLGREPLKNGLINWNEIIKRSKSILKERLNIDIDVKKELSSYSIAIQQMVAIARAVDMSKGILILDEPTSSLDKNEVKSLFKVMNKLKNEGMAIIFVTHFLDQVYEISDNITVLRNGKLIGTYEKIKLSKTDLVSKMIGKDIEVLKTYKDENKYKAKKENSIVLECEGLEKRGSINKFNLKINKGEIIGLAGLLGSGRSEIARLIFGIDQKEKGSITIENNIFKKMYPSKAIKSGLAFCPEDRKVEGIIGELSIRENIILALQNKKGFFKYISIRDQLEISRKYIDLLEINTNDTEKRIDKLSGGNQQKVILARWLATNPKVLILDEPTRGIDVGTKSEIRKLIKKLANDGMTIIFISSEIEEIIECCDRVVVLRDRNVIGELSGKEMNEKNIMTYIAEGGIKSEK